MALLEDTLTNLIQSNGGALSLPEFEAAQLAEFRARPAEVDTSQAFAGANRVNEGARLRGSNTQATIDAKGQTVITGSGSVGEEGAKLQGSMQDPMQSAMLRASTAKTPDELLAATQDLLGQQAIFEARKNEDAIKAASIQAGVPQLEQRLQAEILADQNDPKYTGYDSKITAEIRDQLARAKSESRIVANQLIASDPELARLKVETNFMANKASTNALRMMQRDEIQTQQDLEKGELISNKTTDALKFFYPGETLGKSRGALFDFHKNNKDKEIQVVADNADRPEVLLDLAVTKGSGRAKDFLVHQSAVEASGTDDTTSESYLMARDKTRLDLAELEKLARNPEEAIEAAFGPANADAAKTKIAEVTAELTMKTPSEKAEYQKQVGMVYAKQAIEQKKAAEFSLVSTWKASEQASLRANPLTNDMITRAASKKGGQPNLVTIQDLVTEINLLEPAKQSEAFKFILESAGNEVETRNKGLFGLNTNRYEIERQLKEMLLASKTPTTGLFANILNASLGNLGNVGGLGGLETIQDFYKTESAKYTNPRTGE